MDEAVTKQQALDASKNLRNYTGMLGAVATRLHHTIQQFIESPPSAPRAEAMEAKLRAALVDIEMACNYSPHRDAGTWDANLAQLIHHHTRLLTSGEPAI